LVGFYYLLWRRRLRGLEEAVMGIKSQSENNWLEIYLSQLSVWSEE